MSFELDKEQILVRGTLLGKHSIQVRSRRLRLAHHGVRRAPGWWVSSNIRDVLSLPVRGAAYGSDHGKASQVVWIVFDVSRDDVELVVNASLLTRNRGDATPCRAPLGGG